MKNKFSVILFIVAYYTTFSQTTAIKIAPLISAKFEHQITDKATVQLGVGYSTLDFLGKNNFTNFSGGIRIYALEALYGFYVHPIVTSSTVTSYPSTIGASGSRKTTDQYFSYGIIFGHQRVQRSGFTFDRGIGFAYGQLISSTDSNPNPNRLFHKIIPKLNFAVGYAF